MVHRNSLSSSTIAFLSLTLSYFYYFLTPWCRVLLEKLTGLQLVKKFPAFHGTRKFITALTSVHHLSLSWASPTQSVYPHPNYWRSILISSTHLRLGFPRGLTGFIYFNFCEIYTICSAVLYPSFIAYFSLFLFSFHIQLEIRNLRMVTES